LLPGVGKTLSAWHYADWHHMRGMVEGSGWSYRGFNRPDWHTLIYTPVVGVTPLRITSNLDNLVSSHAMLRTETIHSTELRRHVHGASMFTELLVIDEADRLSMGALEQVRDYYDRSHMGLILIGMPGIEKRLSRYPQLYSRVGFVHHYRALSPAALAKVLAANWSHLGLDSDDPGTQATIAAIIRTTSGNFRLVTRLLTQTQRIAHINTVDRISADVIEAARDVLVIGA
jgi:DNA transposition AAA+ family ATPase